MSTLPPQFVRRVEDVLVHGLDEARKHPMVDAGPISLSLVVYDGAGWPGLLLSDGSVLVVPWNQLVALRDAADKLAKLGVGEIA